MKYPYLNSIPEQKDFIDLFAGMNHNQSLQENEFYDMKNMTGDLYPAISTRPARSIYSHNSIQIETSVTVDDHIISVGKTGQVYRFFIDGTWNEVTTLPLQELNAGEKRQIIAMGTYVVIFPDKICFDTSKLLATDNISPTDIRPLDFKKDFVCSPDHKLYIRNCREDGNEYQKYTSSATEPENPANTDVWYDTKNHALKQYAADEKRWISVSTSYIRIECDADETTKPFSEIREYDTVHIDIPGTNTSGIVGDFIVWKKGTIIDDTNGDKNYILIAGFSENREITSGTVSFKRTSPDFQFVTACNNRLWGCRYAEKDGKMINEIYACKQGDPFNWNSYMGISGDSYAATIGFPGDFTAATTYRGKPIFFKEERIYTVYGDKPSNYQISETIAPGVEKGSHNSVCMIDGSLYYKSKTAICRFSGDVPIPISDKLGKIRMTEASAGSLDGKYYICMKDSDGKYSLFVCDTEKGIWHKEDYIHILNFYSWKGELYGIAKSEGKNIIIGINGKNAKNPYSGLFSEKTEKSFDWFCETGDIGMTTPDMKSVTKLQIRYTAEPGTDMTVYAKYDSEDDWSVYYKIPAATRKRTAEIPLLNRRCDHLRLKIAGNGSFRIDSIAKTVHPGSEVT